jgi:hypothetical protein
MNPTKVESAPTKKEIGLYSLNHQPSSMAVSSLSN